MIERVPEIEIAEWVQGNPTLSSTLCAKDPAARLLATIRVRCKDRCALMHLVAIAVHVDDAGELHPDAP